jgi:hypothetical protein
LIILGTSSTARAQEASRAAPIAAGEEPAAEELISRGIVLRKSGEDSEALKLFQQAYAQRASPRGLAQIALAYQALGQWGDAERGLIDVLHESSDEWVARNRVYLDASLSAVQEHLGWLEVESNFPGATLWVETKLAGQLPMAGPLRVEAGTLTIEVRAPAVAPLRRTLYIEPKSRHHELFTFVAQPAADHTALPLDPRAAQPPARETASPSRTAGWVTLAGAGGLLLIGGAALITRELEAQIYDDNAQCGPLDGKSRYDRCGTNRDIGSAAQAVAVAAFVGSGVAAATAFVLLGTARPRVTKAGLVGCGVASLGVVCGGAF